MLGRKTLLATLTALVVSGLVMAGAFAAQERAGGGPKINLTATVYMGTIMGMTPNGNSVSFQVSQNGKSLLNYRSSELGPRCFGSAGASPAYQTSVKISHRRFTVKKIERAAGFETVTGSLLSGGRAKGTIEGVEECLLPPNFRSGTVKHYHDSWSATSEPDGKASRFCYDHVKPTGPTGGLDLTDIIVFHSTCQTAYKAMNAGTLAKVPPTPPAFTTPGWNCTILSPTGEYSCKKGSASFTFTVV